jgi:hypothetical protein
MRIVVVNHVTLDGIMQGPGRPDEDTREGFTHGGRAAERGGDGAITNHPSTGAGRRSARGRRWRRAARDNRLTRDKRKKSPAPFDNRPTRDTWSRKR